MKYTLLTITFIIILSCKKNETIVELPACNLLKATVEGSLKDSLVFKYDKNNKLNEVLRYQSTCSKKWTFSYPKANQLVISYLPDCPDTFQDFFPLIVDYNSAGKIIEMKKNPSNGSIFTVQYTGDNISSLTRKIQNSSEVRYFEYIGNNVSQSYRLLNGNYKAIDYEGLKYDNMKTNISKEYMVLKLYTSTFIKDGMFDYLSENNVLNYKRYLGSITPVSTVESIIQYNSSQFPIKIISKVADAGGASYSTTGYYQYSCK